METKDEQIARLRTALQHAASVFETYQLHHIAKGDVEKADRNGAMVRVCVDALAEPDESSDTDKYRGQFFVSPSGRWGLLLGQGRAVEFEMNGTLAPRDSDVRDTPRTVFDPAHSREIAKKFLDLLAMEGVMALGPQLVERNRCLTSLLKRVTTHEVSQELVDEIDAALKSGKEGA